MSTSFALRGVSLMLCAGLAASLQAKDPFVENLPTDGADPVPFNQPQHTVNNKATAIEEPQRIPLGVLSAYGVVNLNEADLKIYKVIEGGVAAKGGLQIGDIVKAVNGKDIKTTYGVFSANEGEGGAGPHEAFGFGIEESIRDLGYVLTLTVLRGSETKDIKINLPRLPPLNDNYPFDDYPDKKNKLKKPRPCARSYRILHSTIAALLRHKGQRQNIGGLVQSCTAGLGIMGSYELSYMPHIIDIKDYMMANEPGHNDGLPAWALNFGTTYLCEYYLATGDESVLPRINERLQVSKLWTSPEGKHGHGQEVGYKGYGINIITSHHFLNFCLARKCFPAKEFSEEYDETIEAIKGHLRRSRNGDGSVGYGPGCGLPDATGITGMTSIGFGLESTEKRFADQYAEALKSARVFAPTEEDAHNLHKMLRNCHAVGSFGWMWGTAAAVSFRNGKLVGADQVDEEGKPVQDMGYRNLMDYWKWAIVLGEAPPGSKVTRYYIPSKGNCAGDGYLGYDIQGHAMMAMVMSTGKQALWVHGNRKRNWYNKEALLRRLGIWDKIQKLVKQIDAYEANQDYRKAYDLMITELKPLDDTHEYLFTKTRNWKQLANNQVNIMLPVISARDYAFAYRRMKEIQQKFGPILAPRAIFYANKMDASEEARRQLVVGSKVDIAMGMYERGELNAEKTIARLAEYSKEFEHTGYWERCNENIAKIREANGMPVGGPSGGINDEEFL